MLSPIPARAWITTVSLGVAACDAPAPEPMGGPTAIETWREPLPPLAPGPPAPLESMKLVPLDPWTDLDFRGLSVVDERVFWVGGMDATVLRTVDGGTSFERIGVPATREAQFRDVEAFDERVAVVMSAGLGELSQIYRTTDRGRHWLLCATATDPNSFWDGMAFWNRKEGLVYGDPVEGRFEISRTEDGGNSWAPIARADRPEAKPGEAGFAASGTGIAVAGSSHAWFCSGGVGPVRVFRSTNGGRSWEAVETPLEVRAPSSGAFSLAFRDTEHGILVGGDYLLPHGRDDNVAVTQDGGRTWTVPDSGPGGHRACVAVRPEVAGFEALCVGRAGVDCANQGGADWTALDLEGWYCVDFASANVAYVTGSGGRIARLIPGR